MIVNIHHCKAPSNLRELIDFSRDKIDGQNVTVDVTYASWESLGLTRCSLPPGSAKSIYLCLNLVAVDRAFPYESRSKLYQCSNADEMILAILAHEFKHVEQFQAIDFDDFDHVALALFVRRYDSREHEAEEYAKDRLQAWRKLT